MAQGYSLVLVLLVRTLEKKAELSGKSVFRKSTTPPSCNSVFKFIVLWVNKLRLPWFLGTPYKLRQSECANQLLILPQGPRARIEEVSQ
eukprot:maker-scaffold_12-snap-gene-9.3-mRNA-1 protein AED:0.35 eAED:0.49 QI:0/0/0.25/0.75/0/0/4/237/88